MSYRWRRQREPSGVVGPGGNAGVILLNNAYWIDDTRSASPDSYVVLVNNAYVIDTAAGAGGASPVNLTAGIGYVG